MIKDDFIKINLSKNNPVFSYSNDIKISLPINLGIIIPKKNQKDTFYSQNELIAESIASYLSKIKEIKSVSVIDSTETLNDETNAILLFDPETYGQVEEQIKNLPKWLWINGSGTYYKYPYYEQWRETYLSVMSSCKFISEESGSKFIPLGLDYETILKEPNIKENEREEYEGIFIGNAYVHYELFNIFSRIIQEGHSFSIYGNGWSKIGLVNKGIISPDQIGKECMKHKIGVDHISTISAKEGLSSTKIYQMLASGIPVVTNQPKEIIPEDIHQHIRFANGHRDMYDKIIQLFYDPILRSRLKHGCRKKMEKYTLKKAAIEIWKTMFLDINNRI